MLPPKSLINPMTSSCSNGASAEQNDECVGHDLPSKCKNEERILSQRVARSGPESRQGGPIRVITQSLIFCFLIKKTMAAVSDI